MCTANTHIFIPPLKPCFEYTHFHLTSTCTRDSNPYTSHTLISRVHCLFILSLLKLIIPRVNTSRHYLVTPPTPTSPHPQSHTNIPRLSSTRTTPLHSTHLFAYLHIPPHLPTAMAPYTPDLLQGTHLTCYKEHTWLVTRNTPHLLQGTLPFPKRKTCLVSTSRLFELTNCPNLHLPKFHQNQY